MQEGTDSKAQTTDLPKYGVVLSGGGALGFAHIGALMALEKAGIEISMVSGASMGSIIGAMYASGIYPTAEAIRDFIKKDELYKFHNIFNVNLFSLFNSRGMSDHKKVKKILDVVLPNIETFEDLKKRSFALSMTNFIDLKPEYVDSGDKLKEKIMASAAIPVVFKPVIIEGIAYVDGGIMNNLPIEPLKGRCQKIIMIDVMAGGRDELTSLKLEKIAYRAVMAMMKQMNIDRIAQADYYVRFEKLEKYNMFDFEKYNEIVNIGQKGMELYIKEHPELKEGIAG